MRALLEKLENDIEQATGRSVAEIRDTPICLTENAKDLRKQYHTSLFLRRRHQQELERNCAEYRKIKTQKLPKQTKDIKLLNLGIYHLRHKYNYCHCINQNSTLSN